MRGAQLEEARYRQEERQFWSTFQPGLKDVTIRDGMAGYSRLGQKRSKSKEAQLSPIVCVSGDTEGEDVAKTA